jgi:hypothetical protein
MRLFAYMSTKYLISLNKTERTQSLQIKNASKVQAVSIQKNTTHFFLACSVQSAALPRSASPIRKTPEGFRARRHCNRSALSGSTPHTENTCFSYVQIVMLADLTSTEGGT